MTWQISCDNLEESLALAERIGQQLEGQEVIELISDIGGGKTTFVKGIAKGIGSDDQVTSPTFTLSNVYEGTQLDIHHYDFYRLGEAGIMSDELAETLHDKRSATIVEWANIVENVLPKDRLSILIKVTGEESRTYMCKATGAATTLLERIQA